MRQLIAFAAIAACIFLLFGCTGSQEKKNGPAQNATLPEPEKIPPKTYRLPVEEKKPEAVPNVAPEPEKKSSLAYVDNEFGVSFTRPEGADFLSDDCKYWGGSQFCRAMVYNKSGKVKLLEYGAAPADTRLTLRKWLEQNGALDRKKGVWYEVNFSNVGGIELDAGDASVFSKTLYLPIAGNILKIEANGKGAEWENAKKTYESILVGGQKGKKYYPLEFECGSDTDCLKGEYCSSRTVCTNLDPANTQLNDYFGSPIACASGGPDVCRRACKADADCPRGQQCFTMKRTKNGVQAERQECA